MKMTRLKRMASSIYGVLTNTALYDYCPEVLEAFVARGDEMIGHGHTNSDRQGTMPEAKEKELILRATYYNLALYEITKSFAPDKIKGGKGPKDWNKHNDEIMEGSKEVIAAVKANDPAALKKAMGRIGGGCTECHADFRDR